MISAALTLLLILSHYQPSHIISPLTFIFSPLTFSLVLSHYHLLTQSVLKSAVLSLTTAEATTLIAANKPQVTRMHVSTV
jgi:hypothetical protein